MNEDQEESQRQEESDQDSEDKFKSTPGSRIQSIQKVYEKERFSFGKEEPKAFSGTYTPVTNGEMHEMEPISEGEDNQEEYLQQDNRMYAPKAGNFLDDIREESQSQKSSAYMEDEIEQEHDVDMDNQQVKKHKIYFGDIAQKEFQSEEPYQYQEYYEEEDESEQGNFEEVPSIEEIRSRIKSNKLAIQQSMVKLKNTRADMKQRKRQKQPLWSCGNSLQPHTLLLKKSPMMGAILDSHKMSFTSSVDKVYSESVIKHKGSEFSEDQKTNMVGKYMSEHYQNILESLLKASDFTLHKNKEVNNKFGAMNLKQNQSNVNANNTPLPVVESPSKPYEYSEMFFDILRKSRDVLSPTTVENNDIAQDCLREIKNIVNKDCQVIALINACFGNSYIDLSTYMNVPSKLTKTLLEKYRTKFDDKEEAHRKSLLQNWLKYATVDEIKKKLKEVASDEDTDKFTLASLYLYCGNKNAAANLINEERGNQRNKSNQYLMAFLEGGYEYHNNVSWKCNLGRIIWYANQGSFQEGYEFMIKEISDFQNRQSNQIDSSHQVGDPTELDDPFMWEIICLYCAPKDVHQSFFRERGIDGQNSMVRRTFWTAITCLKKLNQHVMSIEEEKGNTHLVQARKNFDTLVNKYYKKVTFEYAFELETQGLWKWAVFVVLHLENSADKTKYIKDILLKNATQEQDLDFLMQQCKVPANYVHEAKAVYYGYKGMYAKAFYHWYNGGFYQQAHDVLVSHMIVSTESLPQKFNDIETIVEKLEQKREYIRDWDNQGKVLYTFLQFRREVEPYFSQFFDTYGEFTNVRDSDLKTTAAESVKELIEKLDKLIKVFERFRRFDVSETSAVVKTELKRIMLDWDTKLKIMNSKLGKDRHDIMFPNQILMDSQDLNINDKKNAQDKFNF